jgi:beta-xylosidase
VDIHYTNPVWQGDMPDPFALKWEGQYYAFGTGGQKREANGNIFPVLRSNDLVHWQDCGGALIPPPAELGDDFWAPEVAYDGGKFYLYYSIGKGLRHQLRVATSESPVGPYQDTGMPLVDPRIQPFCIDAHPFRDDDGQWYLFYARDFLDTEHGYHQGTALVMDRLATMTRLAGEETTILRARHDWTLFEAQRSMPHYGITADWHTLEGPCVRKHAGRYYCFYSGSSFMTENYGVDYAISSSVRGPYTGEGSEARVLRSVPGKVRGPGHHSIVPGPDGQTEYIVYHAWDAQMQARQMCIDCLLWTPEGPRCAGPSVDLQQISI